MSGRTLYDILEVSRDAPLAAIRAAYERLSRALEDEAAYGGSDSGIRFRQTAVQDAFLTLGDPAKRAAYNERLARPAPVKRPEQPAGPFWTVPRIALVAALVLGAGGLYHKHQLEQERIAAEKEIALAKAKHAEEQAKIAAEEERARQEHQRRRDLAIETRQRHERDRMFMQLSAEQKAQERTAEQRERMEQRRNEAQRRREEQQAFNTANQLAARERAALCQMERERYGRAVSCPH